MIKKRIVIIGAGKLAHSLTSALLNAGYPVQSVIGRKISSAKSLAKKFSILHYSNSPKKIPDDIKIFFLTVPDGEIKKVAEKLSKLNRDFKDCICIHFSGVENTDSLRTLAKKGCAIGSLHIMQTFPTKNIVEIKYSTAAIEGEDKRAVKYSNQLCSKLKLKSIRISSEEKVFYHLAGVYSSNFLVENLFNAFSLFPKGIKPHQILKKTSQSTLSNIFSLSPAKALSGPVDRGDIYTIKKHIESLDIEIRQVKRNDRFKLLRANYIVQSLSLLEVVKAKYGKLSKNHLKIKKFLMSKLG